MKKRHNGPGEQPGNDPIQTEAAYFAACQGWYDTSEAAQKANLLHVSVTDMVNISDEARPAGVTHQFFVCVENTSCIVSRYEGGHYEVQEYDQFPQHRQERAAKKKKALPGGVNQPSLFDGDSGQGEPGQG